MYAGTRVRRPTWPGTCAARGRGGPAGPGRVLPDGCLDLHVDQRRAGRRRSGHRRDPRRAAGRGRDRGRAVPARARRRPCSGCRRRRLRDQRVPLAELWPDAPALAAPGRRRGRPGRGAGGRGPPAPRRRPARRPGRRRRRPPAGASRGWAGTSSRSWRGGAGLSERQLHRRCVTAFGYGPKTLGPASCGSQRFLVAGPGRPGGRTGPAGRRRRLRGPGPPRPRLPRSGRRHARRADRLEVAPAAAASRPAELIAAGPARTRPPARGPAADRRQRQPRTASSQLVARVDHAA